MASSIQILLDEVGAQINYAVATLNVSDLAALFAIAPFAPYDKCTEPVEIKGYQGTDTYQSRLVVEWRSPVDKQGLANGTDLQARFKELCAQVEELQIDRIVITSNFRHHVACIVRATLSTEDNQTLSVNQLTPAPA